MSEKKELNNEELEKVSGGLYGDVNDINWLFSKDETAHVVLSDNTQVEGKVTKRGIISLYQLVFAFYYIESSQNAIVDGWYPGENFSNKTVNISNKNPNGDTVQVVAW